jgi:uncharacterized protein YndB with AHSA1/START domain
MRIIFLTILLATVHISYSQKKVETEVFDNSNGETILHCSFQTQASTEKIWEAISTSAGLSKWAAPAALVELKIGGAYEVYFRPENPAGKRGMEGNKILSYTMHKMISYSGGLPDTWVVYIIEPDGDKRKVHFYGIGTHAEWKAKCLAQAPAVGDFINKLLLYLEP